MSDEREIVIDGSGAYLLGKTWKDIHARYTEAVSRRETLTMSLEGRGVYLRNLAGGWVIETCPELSENVSEFLGSSSAR